MIQVRSSKDTSSSYCLLVQTLCEQRTMSRFPSRIEGIQNGFNDSLSVQVEFVRHPDIAGSCDGWYLH